MAFEFSYSLTGPGWAKAVVSDGEHRATVTASYLTDALRDLLDAVAEVAEDDSESRCLWTEEPGEFRWIFRRAQGDVEIQVIEFKETYSRASDLDGILRFRSGDQGELPADWYELPSWSYANGQTARNDVG